METTPAIIPRSIPSITEGGAYKSVGGAHRLHNVDFELSREHGYLYGVGNYGEGDDEKKQDNSVPIMLMAERMETSLST